MIIRLLTLFILSPVLVFSQDQTGSKGIDHLVPTAGQHVYSRHRDYNSKLRKILLSGVPKDPRAFALVTGGFSHPEYCVFLVRTDDGYMIEARQPTRNIWYDKSGESNPVKIYRKKIPKEKGDKIAEQWRDMLTRVRSPKSTGVAVLDGGSSYYAAFIHGERTLTGETPNHRASGGKLSELAKLTNWMATHSMGTSFFNHNPKLKTIFEGLEVEQGDEEQRF